MQGIRYNYTSNQNKFLNRNNYKQLKSKIMFLKSTKLNLRYKVAVGNITTEDLWACSLETLDELAKSINKSIKEAGEESFIKVKTDVNKIDELKLEVVKQVIEIKLAEQEAKKTAVEKRQKKKVLLYLIATKELEGLASKSVEELKAEVEKMD